MVSLTLTAEAPAFAAPEWVVRPGLLPYPEAVAAMEEHVAAMAAGRRASACGSSNTRPSTRQAPARKTPTSSTPVFRSSGQAAAVSSPITGLDNGSVYPMLNLKQRNPDVRAFVRDLEEWLIRALAEFGVLGERRADRVGIWVTSDAGARGQDRRHRRARAALDHVSRCRAEHRAGPVALCGDRSVRHPRARRHQLRRSGRRRRHEGRRCRAEARV